MSVLTASVHSVVKIDVEAVGAMLTRGRYIYRMASFRLDGETFEYLKPDPGHQPEDARSREYGSYPKVLASLPLADGGTVTVYAVAERWNPSHILVGWADDGRHAHWAWLPAGNVERVTDSDWDIEEYRRCHEHLRGIHWGTGCRDSCQPDCGTEVGLSAAALRAQLSRLAGVLSYLVASVRPWGKKASSDDRASCGERGRSM